MDTKQINSAIQYGIDIRYVQVRLLNCRIRFVSVDQRLVECIAVIRIGCLSSVFVVSMNVAFVNDVLYRTIRRSSTGTRFKT